MHEMTFEQRGDCKLKTVLYYIKKKGQQSGAKICKNSLLSAVVATLSVGDESVVVIELSSRSLRLAEPKVMEGEGGNSAEKKTHKKKISLLSRPNGSLSLSLSFATMTSLWSSTR